MNSMWSGDTTKKDNWCEAFIQGEREGVSSQQAAESLNGAYRQLGYRDGPMVHIAERAIAREIRILRDNQTKYRELIRQGELVGPRLKEIIA